MAKYIVATVDEIPPGERKILEVGGRLIGVFNIGGEYFALRNQCPHQGGPLCQGNLSGLIQSNKPGDYTYSRTNEIIRCPWHGWEFDIRTGQSWVDPAKTRVRSYEVSLEAGANLTDGKTSVDDGAANDVPAGKRKKGPYVAETYEVSVEEAYVVVEV